MSAEERKEFEEFKAKKAEKERLAKQKSDRDTYKVLVDEAIEAVFPIGQVLAMVFGSTKPRIYGAFNDVIELKNDIYGINENQESHTWTHSNGKMRVVLGYNVNDDYDDTVSIGEEKVRNYLASLVDGEKTQALVNAVLRLLAKGKNSGTLVASRILQLRKMAEESGDAEFIDGVKIIEEAYRPAPSKQYVKMYYKGALNEWIAVPLGMTEARNSYLDMDAYHNLMNLINKDLSSFILPKKEEKKK